MSPDTSSSKNFLTPFLVPIESTRACGGGGLRLALADGEGGGVDEGATLGDGVAVGVGEALIVGLTATLSLSSPPKKCPTSPIGTATMASRTKQPHPLATGPGSG